MHGWPSISVVGVLINMEIVVMSAIELKLDKTSSGSEAFFSGTVEAVKSTGYKFSGTLKVSAPFNRKDVDFSNTVRIGHGGVSGKYEHLDLDLGKGPVSDKTLKVEGEGKRAANEKVEFYVAVNEGISGQYKESPEVTCDLDTRMSSEKNSLSGLLGNDLSVPLKADLALPDIVGLGGGDLVNLDSGAQLEDDTFDPDIGKVSLGGQSQKD